MPDYSGYSNEVLYRMCSEQPKHSDVDVIESKIGLIGRAYAATMERKATTSTGIRFNLHYAAHEIVKFGHELDTRISQLTAAGRPESGNVGLLVSTHAWLTSRFRDLTGLEKRSLASKYLHFHAPLSVFIFDSVAKKKLRTELVGRRSDRKVNGAEYPDGDKEYVAFALDCLRFRKKKEHEVGKFISPRRLDSFLYDPDYISRLQQSSSDQSPRHKYWAQHRAQMHHE